MSCFPIDPPVRIVSPSQSQMELCQQTSERMVLSCEISRPNATVRWYRDGREVEESDSLFWRLMVSIGDLLSQNLLSKTLQNMSVTLLMTQ